MWRTLSDYDPGIVLQQIFHCSLQVYEQDALMTFEAKDLDSLTEEAQHIMSHPCQPQSVCLARILATPEMPDNLPEVHCVSWPPPCPRCAPQEQPPTLVQTVVPWQWILFLLCSFLWVTILAPGLRETNRQPHLSWFLAVSFSPLGTQRTWSPIHPSNHPKFLGMINYHHCFIPVPA